MRITFSTKIQELFENPDYGTFLFRADVTQKKSTNVTQKNPCNISENESVYHLREIYPVCLLNLFAICQEQIYIFVLQNIPILPIFAAARKPDKAQKTASTWICGSSSFLP
jgi:hypothetical protein